MSKKLNEESMMSELTGSAFFSPEKQETKNEEYPVSLTKESKNDTKPTTKKQLKQENNVASNITILQFTDDEIEELRNPSYMAQTFRLTPKEIEWFKDTSYRLSKEVKRGKVSQADILRISVKLFENLLASNKAELIKVLERIK